MGVRPIGADDHVGNDHEAVREGKLASAVLEEADRRKCVTPLHSVGRDPFEHDPPEDGAVNFGASTLLSHSVLGRDAEERDAILASNPQLLCIQT